MCPDRHGPARPLAQAGPKLRPRQVGARILIPAGLSGVAERNPRPKGVLAEADCLSSKFLTIRGTYREVVPSQNSTTCSPSLIGYILLMGRPLDDTRVAGIHLKP